MHILGGEKGNPFRQEWGTPKEIFEALHGQWKFTVDGAARRQNAKLKRFWSKVKNALKISWEGERVFINPPFAKAGAFVRKAYKEVLEGGCELAVLLVPCNFDRGWAKVARMGRIEVYDQRFQFLEPPEVKKEREAKAKPLAGPAGGCMLVIFEKGKLKKKVPKTISVGIRSVQTGELVFDEPMEF